MLSRWIGTEFIAMESACMRRSRMRGFSFKEYWKQRPSGCLPGRVKHRNSLLKGTDDRSSTVSFASANVDADYLVEFTFVPRPMEPNDVDNLVCCPPPEPCILHDGILFKDRLANSQRRGTDLLGTMRETDHIEYYSTPSRRRSNRSSQELLQPPALIAPDLVATKIID